MRTDDTNIPSGGAPPPPNNTDNNRILEAIVAAQKLLSRHTLYLAFFTFLLFTVTLVGVAVAYFAFRDSRTLTKAEYVLRVNHDMNEFLARDTVVDKWYVLGDSTVLPSSPIYDSVFIDSLRLFDRPGLIKYVNWRKSITTMLNFFEDLNSLYKKDLIDDSLVNDLFSGIISSIYNKPFVHKYVNYKRELLMYRYKYTESNAAKTFDAIYIWANRFGIHCEADSACARWEKYYYQDEKSTEHLVWKHATKFVSTPLHK